jgi:ATP-dependent protease ClpP protease subunit
MAKELYLYSPIYDFVAEDLISSLEENKDEDITLRLNTPGGNVFAGWGIIAKMKEHSGKFKVKIDGYAASMGAIIVLFASDVEALDVSRIMIHRADRYISSPEDQIFLNNVNKELKAKLASKINLDKLRELKGITLDEIFNPEGKIDVWLTAKEAKEIGLINKITKIKPEEVKAFNQAMFDVAAKLDDPAKNVLKPENKNMTLQELKAQHPEVYAAAAAEGVAKEKDRVGAWVTFAHIDLEEVKKGIKSGEGISQTAMAEFTMKSLNAQSLKNISGENADTVSPEATTKKVVTPKEKEISDWTSEVMAELNLKTA